MTLTKAVLDEMTREFTAFPTFDELMTHVRSGYTPTLNGSVLGQAELGDAIEASGGRVFYR